jgi:hypothetical protein
MVIFEVLGVTSLGGLVIFAIVYFIREYKKSSCMMDSEGHISISISKMGDELKGELSNLKGDMDKLHAKVESTGREVAKLKSKLEFLGRAFSASTTTVKSPETP